MTLLQLRRALAAVPSAYDNATVFIDQIGPRTEATVLMMFASFEPGNWSEASVWICDHTDFAGRVNPALIIMPGTVYG
jgi:hypothetical protein